MERVLLTKQETMNICMFAKSLPVHILGGLEDIIWGISKELSRLGHKVVIITNRHPSGKEKEEFENLTIYYLTSPAASFSGSSKWREESEKKFFELNSLLPFDIIHSHSGAGYAVAFSRRRIAEIPFVLSFYGTPVDEIITRVRLCKADYSPRGVLKNIAGIFRQALCHGKAKKLVRKAARVVVDGTSQYEKVKKYYPEANEVTVVNNGINTSLFFPENTDHSLYEKHSLKPGSPVLLCVAKLEWEKGIQVAIKALEKLKAVRGDIRLLIVGSGSARSRLEKLASQLRVEEYLRFAGPVPLDRLPAYFNICTVFLNLTLRENGYDLTVLEAMACKKPVVVSRLNSLLTIVADGENGKSIETGNASSAAVEIENLLKNPSLMKTLAENGYDMVNTGYSLSAMAQNCLNLYQTLIKKKGDHAAQSFL